MKGRFETVDGSGRGGVVLKREVEVVSVQSENAKLQKDYQEISSKELSSRTSNQESKYLNEKLKAAEAANKKETEQLRQELKASKEASSRPLPTPSYPSP
ncbi:hypothetical protein TrST_g11059 [Triparma strigata]|uniref:Uncharacterized protein n=1 Tax=Triparma strigata TaxID=1606541 RepID=A0A9W7EIT6_9STRA|nr:hypothetical protein TrST_g11059 [Triparma strigata]